MNWLQFISDTIGHLAWPVVVLIIVFAVRKHLGSLAERILELSFGGATLKFGQLLSKGAGLIEHAPPLPPPPLPPASFSVPAPPIGENEPQLPPPVGAGQPLNPEQQELLRKILSAMSLTTGSPVTTAPSITTMPGPGSPASVMYAPWMIVAEYGMLEIIFNQIGELLKVKTRHGDTLMDMLYRRGLVSAEAVELHKTLRQARNEVAHSAGSPSEVQIAEYKRQAEWLREALLDANRELAIRQAERDSGPNQPPPAEED